LVQASFDAVLEDFSDSELAGIARFLNAVVARSRAAIAELGKRR
jgi:hypothetical protein